jgi:hypothetical protein
MPVTMLKMLADLKKTQEGIQWISRLRASIMGDDLFRIGGKDSSSARQQQNSIKC